MLFPPARSCSASACAFGAERVAEGAARETECERAIGASNRSRRPRVTSKQADEYELDLVVNRREVVSQRRDETGRTASGGTLDVFPRFYPHSSPPFPSFWRRVRDKISSTTSSAPARAPTLASSPPSAVERGLLSTGAGLKSVSLPAVIVGDIVALVGMKGGGLVGPTEVAANFRAIVFFLPVPSTHLVHEEKSLRAHDVKITCEVLCSTRLRLGCSERIEVTWNKSRGGR